MLEQLLVAAAEAAAAFLIGGVHLSLTILDLCKVPLGVVSVVY